MKSINTELALCGHKNKCARTETVFFPISEVSEGTVSPKNINLDFFNISVIFIFIFLMGERTQRKTTWVTRKFINLIIKYI